MLNRIGRFVTEMDSRRWRTAAVTALLLAATVGLLLLGKTQMGQQAEHELEAWLQGYRGSPWAFAATFLALTRVPAGVSWNGAVQVAPSSDETCHWIALFKR